MGKITAFTEYKEGAVVLTAKVERYPRDGARWLSVSVDSKLLLDMIKLTETKPRWVFGPPDLNLEVDPNMDVEKNWLSELQLGDLVVVPTTSESHGETHKVSRLTEAELFLDDGTRWGRTDGREIGPCRQVRYLAEATPLLLGQIKHAKRCADLRRVFGYHPRDIDHSFVLQCWDLMVSYPTERRPSSRTAKEEQDG